MANLSDHDSERLAWRMVMYDEHIRVALQYGNWGRAQLWIEAREEVAYRRYCLTRDARFALPPSKRTRPWADRAASAVLRGKTVA